MDRHGNWATAVAAGQPEAVKMAGVRSADMHGLFIPFSSLRGSFATHQEQTERKLHDYLTCNSFYLTTSRLQLLIEFNGTIQTNVQGADTDRRVWMSTCCIGCVCTFLRSERNLDGPGPKISDASSTSNIDMRSSLADNLSGFRSHFNDRSKWGGRINTRQQVFLMVIYA